MNCSWLSTGRTSRRAVTLIELLVVISIVLLLSTIVLRTISPALMSRNLREGARMLNVLLNGARNRAMAQGRPAGIWIDRMAGLPEASVNLFYAQVPEIFTGTVAPFGLVAYTIPDWNVAANRTTVTNFYNVVAPASSSEIWDPSNYGRQTVIQPGDIMHISGLSQEFTLQWSPAVNNWIIGNWTATNKDPVSGNYIYGPVGYTDTVLAPMITQGSSNQAINNAGSSSVRPGVPVSYQIYRQPVKMSAGALQLPEGVIVDLNYSGTDNRPFNVRFKTGDTTGSGTSLAPANGYRGFPIDSSGNPVTTASPNPSSLDNRPIILVFNPSGAIDRMFCRIWSATTNPPGYQWSCEQPVSNIYFLIGRRDKVPLPNPVGLPDGAPQTTQATYNWSDPGNYWVTVQAMSGAVTTSPNVLPMSGTASPLQYMRYIGPNAPSGYNDGLNDINVGSRRLAITRTSTSTMSGGN